MFRTSLLRHVVARRARRVTAVAVAAATVVGLSGLPADATLQPHGDKPGLFCPCWGGPPKDATSWDNAARNLSLLVSGRGVIEKNIARAHQVNPDLLMITYQLGPYVAKTSKIYTDTLRDFPERFARTTDGKLINVPAFPNNILMDVTNAGWRRQMADIVAEMAVKADGVYVDSMGLGPFHGYTSGKPADQTTKQVYDSAMWMAANRDLLSEIKARIGSKYLMFNGISNGQAYKTGSAVLVNSTADGAMTEAWIRGAKSAITAYPTQKKFQLELDEMADVLAKGKEFYAWTKTWVTGTAQQKADWNTFAMAAFLLVNNGRGYYSFVPDNGVDRSVIYTASVQQAELGAPLGPYTLTSATNGVYKREFEKGTVTVNPSLKSASIVVRPGGTTTTSTTSTSTTSTSTTTTSTTTTIAP